MNRKQFLIYLEQEITIKTYGYLSIILLLVILDLLIKICLKTLYLFLNIDMEILIKSVIPYRELFGTWRIEDIR